LKNNKIIYFDLGHINAELQVELESNLYSFFENSIIKWAVNEEFFEVVNGKNKFNDEFEKILLDFKTVFLEDLKYYRYSVFYYNSSGMDYYCLRLSEKDGGYINILLDTIINIFNKQIDNVKFEKIKNDLKVKVNDEEFKLGGSTAFKKRKGNENFYFNEVGINWNINSEKVMKIFDKLSKIDCGGKYGFGEFKPRFIDSNQKISCIKEFYLEYKKLRKNFPQLLADEIGLKLIKKDPMLYLKSIGIN